MDEELKLKNKIGDIVWNYQSFLEELKEREEKLENSINAWNEILTKENIFLSDEEEEFIEKTLLENATRLRELDYIKRRIAFYVGNIKD